ncbi:MULTISPECIES: tetratricopeptide repeat protein [Vibrio]|uniref:Pilus assembly protein TadD n=1 Tax=Vibrio splendidus TaxID=29497 RepID=A0AB35MS39_VIBSP|nr:MULTISPECIES: pilus assembly protein TadD [Vibrio]MDH6017280.1 pilus assembly protein TadD [Vibrio splendidus]MDP2499214.1 pilus assembly protein TadD [Vibrio splendidus]UQV23134.1 pilus assembly protein TadD [Vibrio sp. J383]
MIRKYILTVIMLVLISGCTTVNNQLDTKEQLLIGSGDSQKLIEFYKANIQSDSVYKVKLVNLYLDLKDIKSAELYRSTYSESDLDDPEFILTNARIYYQKKNFEYALEELKNYRDEGGAEYEYQLLTGKILAQQKRFTEAIEHFEESRKQGASDREAGNNIAVVKIMQSDYLGATDILYDLYLSNPNDQRVSSNLILSSVKSQRPDIALEVLKHSNSDEQAHKQLSALMRSISKSKGKKAVTQSTIEMEQQLIGSQVNSGGFVAPTSRVSKLDTTGEFQTSRHSVDGSVLDPRKLKPGAKPIYRVQVLATYTAIPSDFLNYLKTNYGSVYSYTHGLWKRYCIGDFNDLDEAKAFLNSIDIKGAFVVDYTKKRYVRL